MKEVMQIAYEWGCSLALEMWHQKSADNVEQYKVAKKTVKWTVSEARGRMYDGLYQRLGMKEREKDIYRMTKSWES
jgi:hypothetical protein